MLELVEADRVVPTRIVVMLATFEEMVIAFIVCVGADGVPRLESRAGIAAPEASSPVPRPIVAIIAARRCDCPDLHKIAITTQPATAQPDPTRALFTVNVVCIERIRGA